VRAQVDLGEAVLHAAGCRDQALEHLLGRDARLDDDARVERRRRTRRAPQPVAQQRRRPCSAQMSSYQPTLASTAALTACGNEGRDGSGMPDLRGVGWIALADRAARVLRVSSSDRSWCSPALRGRPGQYLRRRPALAAVTAALRHPDRVVSGRAALACGAAGTRLLSRGCSPSSSTAATADAVTSTGAEAAKTLPTSDQLGAVEVAAEERFCALVPHAASPDCASARRSHSATSTTCAGSC
jgi:hypothetical protein